MCLLDHCIEAASHDLPSRGRGRSVAGPLHPHHGWQTCCGVNSRKYIQWSPRQSSRWRARTHLLTSPGPWLAPSCTVDFEIPPQPGERGRVNYLLVDFIQNTMDSTLIKKGLLNLLNFYSRVSNIDRVESPLCSQYTIVCLSTGGLFSSDLVALISHFIRRFSFIFAAWGKFHILSQIIFWSSEQILRTPWQHMCHM